MICCCLEHGFSFLTALNLLDDKSSVNKCLCSCAEIRLGRAEEVSSESVTSTSFKVAGESIYINILFLLSEKNSVLRNLCWVALPLVVNLAVDPFKGIDEVVVTYISI